MSFHFLGDRSRDQWIQQYSLSHQHPVNRWCHTFGIPLVALSVILAIPALRWPAWRPAFWLMFGVGWTLQLLGHVFECKPPEFLSDPRFLFVGLGWWMTKLRKKGPP